MKICTNNCHQCDCHSNGMENIRAKPYKRKQKERIDMKGKIKVIEYKEAIDFLMPRHYSGRKPNIVVAYGWFFGNKLKAVCSFGVPASPSLCKGVCGEKWKSSVLELNRLCRVDDLDEQISAFVGRCLYRQPRNIIVSYADTAMNHVGKIYQSTNFIYTGMTKQRTDKYTPDGKHSRHYDKDAVETHRKIRSAKHRYIYFGRHIKKQAMPDLKYEILPYPDGISEKYELGNFIKDKVIEVKNDTRKTK